MTGSRRRKEEVGGEEQERRQEVGGEKRKWKERSRKKRCVCGPSCLQAVQHDPHPLVFLNPLAFHAFNPLLDFSLCVQIVFSKLYFAAACLGQVSLAKEDLDLHGTFLGK